MTHRNVSFYHKTMLCQVIIYETVYLTRGISVLIFSLVIDRNIIPIPIPKPKTKQLMEFLRSQTSLMSNIKGSVRAIFYMIISILKC